MNGIKRFAAAILCLLLCAPAFGALAEGLTAGPVPVYLDQDGAILDREGSPVSREPADKIIYHDETLLVFLLDNRMLAKTSDDMLKHFGVQVCDPVWAGQDGCIYYVRENAPTTLMCMKPEAATGSTACTTEKPIQALRCGVNGVLVQVDGMEYLYVPALRRLIKQDIPANTRLIPGENILFGIDERDFLPGTHLSAGLIQQLEGSAHSSGWRFVIVKLATDTVSEHQFLQRDFAIVQFF